MVTAPGTNERYRRAVGVFNTREETENALQALKKASFDMNRVSVITQDRDIGRRNDLADTHERKEQVGNKADEGAATGAIAGGALGGITGLLVGLGTLAIPGIGPILLAGAEATAIATTLAGTAMGAAAGGLIGSLVGLGIPEERARVYSDRVARGGYLVMVNGTEADIRRAEAILHERGIEEWGIYDAPDLSNTHRDSSNQPIEHIEPMNTAVVERKEILSEDPEVIIIDHRDEAREAH